MKPTNFLRLTEKAGQTLLLNPQFITAVHGASTNSTVYMNTQQQFVVIESVTQIATQLDTIQEQQAHARAA